MNVNLEFIGLHVDQSKDISMPCVLKLCSCSHL